MIAHGRPGRTVLPRAHGGPAGRGRLRAQPAHFCVSEDLGFAADGTGGHVLLRVRKQDANTQWVARCLARHGDVRERDVGYAGLKDRHAIAEQYFTVPLRPAQDPAAWRTLTGSGFEVLDATLTRRKLRRGAHRGNAFRITVSELEADHPRLTQILERLATQGAPNYFGPQRFGRNGANLAAAWQWFADGAAPAARNARSFALSAARAELFNAVLAARVAAGTWDTLGVGDVANLANSNSIFAVQAVDASLTRRCHELDIHPTGPLWGRGAPAVQGDVAALEREVIESYAELAAGLAAEGLRHERRALRVPVRDLAWTLAPGELTVAFGLPRGAFATAILCELLELDDDASVDSD